MEAGLACAVTARTVFIPRNFVLTVPREVHATVVEHVDTPTRKKNLVIVLLLILTITFTYIYTATDPRSMCTVVTFFVIIFACWTPALSNACRSCRVVILVISASATTGGSDILPAWHAEKITWPDLYLRPRWKRCCWAPVKRLEPVARAVTWRVGVLVRV